MDFYFALQNAPQEKEMLPLLHNLPVRGQRQGIP
jgi:hypothetical protein